MKKDPENKLSGTALKVAVALAAIPALGACGGGSVTTAEYNNLLGVEGEVAPPGDGPYRLLPSETHYGEAGGGENRYVDGHNYFGNCNDPLRAKNWCGRVEVTEGGNLFINGHADLPRLVYESLGPQIDAQPEHYAGDNRSYYQRGVTMVDKNGRIIAVCDQNSFSANYLQNLTRVNQRVAAQHHRGRMGLDEAVGYMAEICNVSESEIRDSMSELAEAGPVNFQISHRRSFQGSALNSPRPSVQVDRISYTGEQAGPKPDSLAKA